MSIRIEGAQSNKIKQYTDIDPINPQIEQAWVLKTQSLGAAQTIGMPMGLLLALTYAASIPTYQFSYRTRENNTIRILMQ